MEIPHLLQEKIKLAVKNTYDFEIDVEKVHVEHPKNETWGDYSTNVAMVLSKELEQDPLEIAKKLSYELSSFEIPDELAGNKVFIFQKIAPESPGFINFTLSSDYLLNRVLMNEFDSEKSHDKNNIGQEGTKKVLFEYTDPNPFKVIHIGHLMSNAIGESLSRLYQFDTFQVKRANYQGDVGLHVSKAIWGVFKKLEDMGKTMTEIDNASLSNRTRFLGECYALGAGKYESDDSAKLEIDNLNYYVYMASQERLAEEENWTPLVDYKKYLNELPEDVIDSLENKYPYEKVKEIYLKGRKWSLEGFETFYEAVGTAFDFYFFESKVGEYGLDLVQKNIGEVFKKDQGAVIFEGENYGLHNRVFVNSMGLPTYEAKDLGLAIMKHETYPYDLSFIITANEINEYFKVVLKAMSLINPELAEKTTHIGHGMMRFKSGKMSSRTGDVITADILLENTREVILSQMEESESPLNADERLDAANTLAVGAIKYSILRQGTGRDVIYDEEQSISVTGNTGPYLQYTHARANSVLEKVKNPDWEYDPTNTLYAYREGEHKLHDRELAVLRHLCKFKDNVELARVELAPNLVCNYLFELAQKFNAFYNDVSILGAEDELALELRLQITKQARDVLKMGLWLLGIKAPEKV